MNFSELAGKTLTMVDHRDSEAVYFTTQDGQCYCTRHQQDCCESVSVQKILGKMDDILGSPILAATETHTDHSKPGEYAGESYTWTNQTIRTTKGKVTFRWLGVSNGYYGETPYFGLSHPSM